VGVEVNANNTIIDLRLVSKRLFDIASWSVGQVAAAIDAQTKQNLGTYTNSSAPSGRGYRGHEGSYPGFPDQVTGTLKRSVYMETAKGLNTYEATVGVGAVYARKVELGGNGSRPFAYLIPAIQTVRPAELFLRKFESRWKG
jgi:phage gpG-like protein